MKKKGKWIRPFPFLKVGPRNVKDTIQYGKLENFTHMPLQPATKAQKKKNKKTKKQKHRNACHLFYFF